jgi:uncharacterized protein YhdP
MTPEPLSLVPTTRPLDPALVEALRRVQPGQRIRITQMVRVGQKTWTTTLTGTFRSVGALVTGLATDRVPEDDIVVPTIHFVKDNGELSSITLDEHTKLEILSEPPAP